MSALVDGENGAAKDAESTEADAGNWYAVGFAGDLHPGDVYGTKFLGEPQVIYRDAEGEATFHDGANSKFVNQSHELSSVKLKIARSLQSLRPRTSYFLGGK